MRAKKNRGKTLLEFIPFGGKRVGGKLFKRKEFRKHFDNTYKLTKGASFGKAKQNQYVKGSGQSEIETVRGWGIFVD